MIAPFAGAQGGHCPLTTLSQSEAGLVAVDLVTGQEVRLAPAAAYHYRHELHFLDARDKWQSRWSTGLAMLDADGLIMLDLPGEWHPPAVHDLMVRAGLPIVDGRYDAPWRVRAILAGRAPGWRRLHGQHVTRWRKQLAIGAGATGAVLMGAVAYTGFWDAWRMFSMFGRLLVEAGEAKWLGALFSPVLLALAPLNRWRMRRGVVVGQRGGPYLCVTGKRILRVARGRETLRCLTVGSARGGVARLLVYPGGLFFLDASGEVVHHLPGAWPAEDVHRFAVRHGLDVAVVRLSHAEYLGLLRRTWDASP